MGIRILNRNIFKLQDNFVDWMFENMHFSQNNQSMEKLTASGVNATSVKMFKNRTDNYLKGTDHN